MKLETSQDLLERIRAKYDLSWYGLIALMEVHKNTVYSWKANHTTVDKRYAIRIAELLDEKPPYVLACLEAERDPDHAKIWQEIAVKFRSHAASILLVALGLFAAPRGATATELDVVLTQELSNQLSMYYAQLAAWMRRQLRKLSGCLKSQFAAPLHPAWARICSTALPLSRSPA
jgi:hypothetical protein